jgi:hypothetical protein
MHQCDRNTIAMIMTLSARYPARRFAIAGAVLAALLACWSGKAFGQQENKALVSFTPPSGLSLSLLKAMDEWNREVAPALVKASKQPGQMSLADVPPMAKAYVGHNSGQP